MTSPDDAIEPEREPAYVAEVLQCSVQRARALMSLKRPKKGLRIRSWDRLEGEGTYEKLFTYDSEILAYQRKVKAGPAPVVVASVVAARNRPASEKKASKTKRPTVRPEAPSTIRAVVEQSRRSLFAPDRS